MTEWVIESVCSAWHQLETKLIGPAPLNSHNRGGILEQTSEVVPFYTLPPPGTITMQAATFNIPSHLLAGFRT